MSLSVLKEGYIWKTFDHNDCMGCVEWSLRSYEFRVGFVLVLVGWWVFLNKKLARFNSMFWTPVIDGVDLFALDWKEVLLFFQSEWAITDRRILCILYRTGRACACCIRQVKPVRVCIWQVEPMNVVSDRRILYTGETCTNYIGRMNFIDLWRFFMQVSCVVSGRWILCV
jgi:hypothetical protein